MERRHRRQRRLAVAATALVLAVAAGTVYATVQYTGDAIQTAVQKVREVGN